MLRKNETSLRLRLSSTILESQKYHDGKECAHTPCFLVAYPGHIDHKNRKRFYLNCVGRDKIRMMYYTTYLYHQSVIQMAFLEVDNYLWNLLRRNIGVAVGLWHVSNAIHRAQLVCMDDE